VATLSTPRKKHSSTFWVLTICALFVAVLVIGVAVLLAVDPGLADALYIAWTFVTGLGGGRPQ
jgi:hypothetical protein